MNFHMLRDQFNDLGCFTTSQVYAWNPDFDKNNLSNWTAKKLIIKLRNGFYIFPEYAKKPNFNLYIANRIYRPSYVSLHSALAFYGIIPESVVQVTSVTTLKTADFTNTLGTYSYQRIKPTLYFGFDTKTLSDGRVSFLASPEKAILDLLYLYTFYNTEGEIRELRLDEDFLSNELNIELLKNYTKKFQSKAVEKRIKILLNTYAVA